MKQPTYLRLSQFENEIRVPVIAPALYDELNRVEPSVDGNIEYRPCQVELSDGTVVDRVYVVEAVTFMLHWGYDPATRSISILDVAHITESPTRLPVRLANVLYEKGETNMGGTVFSIILRDGTKAHGGAGGAVDFLSYPPGVQASDVVDVVHGKSEGTAQFKQADYRWCLFSLPPAEATRRLKSLESVLTNWKVKWSFEIDS